MFGYIIILGVFAIVGMLINRKLKKRSKNMGKLACQTA